MNAANVGFFSTHDHLAMPRHLRHLKPPVIGVGQSAMQKDHGLALAEHGVPQLDAVHRRVAAALGVRQLGRWRQLKPERLLCPGAVGQQQRHQG
jgi:hypothetical protein